MRVQGGYPAVAIAISNTAGAVSMDIVELPDLRRESEGHHRADGRSSQR
jgi:hypothetical protein